MRLSCWQRGQRIGSASQTFLMSPRHFFDGIRRGLNAETSMNSPLGRGHDFGIRLLEPLAAHPVRIFPKMSHSVTSRP